MKVYYECAPCFLRQAKEALDLATDNQSLKMEIMEELVGVVYNDFHKGAVSNVVGTRIHRIIKDRTGNEDPYLLEKRKGNDIALKFLPKIKKILNGRDGLEIYIKAAITGNLIDFGALGVNFDVEKAICKNMEKEITLNQIDELENELKSAKNVLYLADNSGEIVFDKLLIEKLKDYDVDVTVALKEKPILNDACIDDAVQIGMDEVAMLVSTGTDSIGILYADISEEFKKIFEEADLVISKGLGNYEGMTEMELGDKPVFCLFNVKCNAVAKSVGANVGDNVVLEL
ncbi:MULTISPECIES: damage-control phosphatase ARMT1 family protein [Methanobacterium]|uniref:ARMT1-like domain-containing protein n=1 Tax=Methanobacterium veterum TaxID=408577 RepID=A0A9E5DKN4_9EURY|nr:MULTISPECIES: ARMT1-like domain-containing protein [Methanobacterium]MCZ3366493.1 ARMT1-like domain-containing protein [Methanobacterium veterum]MCZ3372001.1 ARMT1-like domain-containing protein [Methanobacterium veterum]